MMAKMNINNLNNNYFVRFHYVGEILKGVTQLLVQNFTLLTRLIIII